MISEAVSATGRFHQGDPVIVRSSTKRGKPKAGLVAFQLLGHGDERYVVLDGQPTNFRTCTVDELSPGQHESWMSDSAVRAACSSWAEIHPPREVDEWRSERFDPFYDPGLDDVEADDSYLEELEPEEFQEMIDALGEKIYATGVYDASAES